MGACYSRREGERYAKDGCVKGAAAAVGTWQVQLEHGWADYDTATQGVLSRAREARKATVDIRRAAETVAWAAAAAAISAGRRGR